MSALEVILFVSVAAAAISIGILVLDDVFAELDRRAGEREPRCERRGTCASGIPEPSARNTRRPTLPASGRAPGSAVSSSARLLPHTLTLSSGEGGAGRRLPSTRLLPKVRPSKRTSTPAPTTPARQPLRHLARVEQSSFTSVPRMGVVAARRLLHHGNHGRSGNTLHCRDRGRRLLLDRLQPLAQQVERASRSAEALSPAEDAEQLGHLARRQEPVGSRGTPKGDRTARRRPITWPCPPTHGSFTFPATTLPTSAPTENSRRPATRSSPAGRSPTTRSRNESRSEIRSTSG